MDWSGAALLLPLLTCPAGMMLMTHGCKVHGALRHDQKHGEFLARIGENR